MKNSFFREQVLSPYLGVWGSKRQRNRLILHLQIKGLNKISILRKALKGLNLNNRPDMSGRLIRTHNFSPSADGLNIGK
jgi:hypothetical protein